MKMMPRNTFTRFGLLIVMIALLSACKTTGPIFGGKIKPLTTEEIRTSAQEREIVFETFSGRAKVDLSAPGLSNSFIASIDMRKDSLIGISLRVLGVEGARVRITPDSIEILDRLNQQYIPRDYSFLRDSFNLNLGFQELQALIVGNPFLYDSATLTRQESEEYYILIASKDVYKNTLTLSPDFDLLRMFIVDLYANRNLTLQYGGYEKIDGRHFALNRNILLNAKENLEAEIEFSDIEFDKPFEFSFSINPKYTRMD